MFSHELSNWHSQSWNPPSLEAFVAALSVLPARAVAISGIEAEAADGHEDVDAWADVDGEVEPRAWNAKVSEFSRGHGPSQKSRAT